MSLLKAHNYVKVSDHRRLKKAKAWPGMVWYGGGKNETHRAGERSH